MVHGRGAGQVEHLEAKNGLGQAKTARTTSPVRFDAPKKTWNRPWLFNFG